MSAPIEDVSDDFVVNKVVKYINSEFGTDISSLGKAKELYEKVHSTKLSLEQQVITDMFNY